MAFKYTSLRKGIKRKNQSWRSLCLDTWFPEIGATVFSIACFIAICGILLAYNQKTRPELRYGLSLNAIISVLATGCKSSLIFVIGEAMGQLKWSWFSAKPNKLLDLQTLDSASRGPLGSITTFFQKTRRSLVSIGAFVIILLLAFDPFIQQIISYPTRLAVMQDSKDAATAKRLNYFAPVMDYNIAFPSAFWSNETILSPSCSTGNCKWPKFQSSGMCSRCSDITPGSMDLKCKKTSTQTFHFSGNVTEEWANVTCRLTPPQGKSTQFNNVHFMFQSSPSLPEVNQSTYSIEGVSWHVYSAWSDYSYFPNEGPAPGWDPHPNSPFTWPSDPLMIIAYAEIGYNEDYLNSDFVRGITVDKVTQCSLELCLLEYDASVENGTPAMATSVLDYGQLFWKNNSESRDIYMGATLCWKPTPGSPSTISLEDAVQNGTGPTIRFSPTEYVVCGIPNAMTLYGDIFVGSMLQDCIRDSNGTDCSTGSPVGDPQASRIGSVGLESFMSNFAQYFNNEALRRDGVDVHGEAYVIEVFVDVQWVWLILPIILVVSGTIFIGIVIMKSRRDGTSLWKSSVLAFIYHGLYDVDKGDTMTASVMETKAEELIVRLQPSDDHGGLILQERRKL